MSPNALDELLDRYGAEQGRAAKGFDAELDAFGTDPNNQPLVALDRQRDAYEQTWPQAVFGTVASGTLTTGAAIAGTAEREVLAGTGEAAGFGVQVAKEMGALDEGEPKKFGIKDVPKLWWAMTKAYYSPEKTAERAPGIDVALTHAKGTTPMGKAAAALRAIADEHPEWTPRQVETAGQLFSDPKALVGNLANMLPFMAATTVAFLATGPTGSAIISYAVESDGAYQDALAKGLSPAQAQRVAQITGSVNAIIEQAQIDQWVKFGKGAARQIVAREVSRRALAKIVAGKAAKLAISEGLEEVLQGTTQDVAMWREGVKPKDFWNTRAIEGVLGAAGGLVMGGGVAGMQFAAEKAMGRPAVAEAAMPAEAPTLPQERPPAEAAPPAVAEEIARPEAARPVPTPPEEAVAAPPVQPEAEPVAAVEPTAVAEEPAAPEGPAARKLGAPPILAARKPGASALTNPAMAAPRIEVAALAESDAPPKSPKELVQSLGRVIGRSVKRRRKLTPLGRYTPSSAAAATRYANDVDVAAHELMHGLDDAYGIVAPWVEKRARSPYDQELATFWWHGSARVSGPRSLLSYKRGEGVAEYLRAWLLNPEAAERQAPQFSKYWQTKIPARVLAELRSWSASVRAWAGIDPETRTRLNIRMEEPGTGLLADLRDSLTDSGVGFRTTALDRLAAVLTDSLAPFVKAWKTAVKLHDVEPSPSANAEILIRNFAGMDVHFERQLMHGPVTQDLKRVEGVGGIDWLIEPIAGQDGAVMQDDLHAAAALMVSERAIEKFNNAQQSVIDGFTAIVDRQVAAALQEHGTTPPADVKAKIDMLSNALRAGQEAEGDANIKLEAIIEALTDEELRQSLRAMSERNLQRASRQTGAGGGMFSDLEVARQTLAAIQSDAERSGRLKELARRYRAWADHMVLRPLLESGRISQDQYDAITKSNQFYVDMHRLLDDANLLPTKPVGKRVGSTANVIQRWLGSTEEIANVYVNLIEGARNAQTEAARTRIKNAFNDMLEVARNMHQGPPVELASIGRRVQQGERNTITTYRDGKPEHWQYEDGVYLALKQWGETADNHLVWKILTLGPSILRAGVVKSPPFMIRNILRDTQQRAVISEAGGKPWDILRPLTAKEVDEFLVSGGGQFGWYGQGRRNYYKILNRAIQKASADRNTILSTAEALARGYNHLTDRSEIVGRMAEYRRCLEKSREEHPDWSDEDHQINAAFKARSLLDFAVSGTFIKKANQIVPFTNAAIQGIRVALKAFRRDPVAFVLRWFMYQGVPTLLLYAWNMAGDDEDREEYRSLPAYQRDLFFNIKIGKNMWLRIPKAFELGVLASGLERAIDYAAGNEKALDGYAASLANSLSPVDASDMAGPFSAFFESLANYNLFTRRPIVPTYEEDAALELRTGKKAGSRAGRLIGNVLSVDARKVDFWIRRQFGELGKIAIAATDVGDKGRTWIDQAQYVTGMFSQSPTTSSNDVSEALKLIRQYKLTSLREMRPLYELLKEHREATTNAEKDRLAREIRQTARELEPVIKERVLERQERQRELDEEGGPRRTGGLKVQRKATKPVG